MLTIKSIDEFRSHVNHREEIRESDIGHGCTAFCYMISGEETFSNEWLRECRGIVFDSQTGRVIGRPLHKFFNVNEKEATRFEVLDWENVEQMMDKRDGSMIHTVLTRDGVKLKSKKTFTSDVALAAQKLWDSDDRYVKFGKFAETLNMTLIFEYTAPTARIVLYYPKEELRLLHIRENESGKYLQRVDVKALAKAHNIPLSDEVELRDFVQPATYTKQTFEWLVQNVQDIEGWIFQFKNGDMVKLKTDWYMKRHRAMTFLRERDIALMVLEEGLDDIKAVLVGDGVDISEILKIEADVVEQVSMIERSIELTYAANSQMDRKTFAIAHKDHPQFGLLMARYTGRDPSYKEYFERNILKDRYSLRQLNLMNSVAEVD